MGTLGDARPIRSGNRITDAATLVPVRTKGRKSMVVHGHCFHPRQSRADPRPMEKIHPAERISSVLPRPRSWGRRLRKVWSCFPGGKRVSERLHAVSARTLGALTFGVFHRLTFLEVVKICSFHRTLVEKQFLTITGDETEAFVVDDFLNRSLCHVDTSIEKNAVPPRWRRAANPTRLRPFWASARHFSRIVRARPRFRPRRGFTDAGRARPTAIFRAFPAPGRNWKQLSRLARLSRPPAVGANVRFGGFVLLSRTSLLPHVTRLRRDDGVPISQPQWPAGWSPPSRSS